MKYIAFLVMVLLSLNVNAAAIKDFAGLEAYIDEVQDRMKAGDEKWSFDNDPRFIQLAEWTEMDVEVMKKHALTGNFPRMTFDEGELQCSTKLGDLTLVVVKHQISVEEDDLLKDDFAVYIRGKEGRWWLTRNKNVRIALVPFREDIKAGMNTREFKDIFVSDECLKSLNL